MYIFYLYIYINISWIGLSGREVRWSWGETAADMLQKLIFFPCNIYWMKDTTSATDAFPEGATAPLPEE